MSPGKVVEVDGAPAFARLIGTQVLIAWDGGIAVKSDATKADLDALGERLTSEALASDGWQVEVR